MSGRSAAAARWRLGHLALDRGAQHRQSSNPRWPSNHQRELMVGNLELCLARGLSSAPAIDLHDLADALGSHRVGALIRTLSLAIAGADDRPRAIELAGAITRLFEAAGDQVDSHV